MFKFNYKKSKKAEVLDIADAIEKKEAYTVFGGKKLKIEALTIGKLFRVLDALKIGQSEIVSIAQNKDALVGYFVEKMPLIAKHIHPDAVVDFNKTTVTEVMDLVLAFWSANDLERVIANFQKAMPSAKKQTRA